ncbi:MAG: hypothetical protein KAQ64_04750 [Candidatus Pacebacteria bacterium]|nr:hypothetical protein [Candidatus Paceibacterota bacterium]
MAENKEKTDENKLGAIDINRHIFDMINELSERSRNIISKRFNLDEKGVQTLDKIGKEYGITRERVRQIESESIARLKQIGKKHNINLIFNNIRETVEDRGGVMSEEEIAKHLFKSKSHDNVNKQVSLLVLSLDDKIKTAKETKTYKKIYFYEKENFAKFKDAVGVLGKYLAENKKNLSFERISSLLKDKGFSYLPKKSIKSYLEANKIILQSVIGEWGHQKWPHINPKNVRDKSYLTLKKSKNPLHFVEIADKMNEIWKNKKRANNQTVHNELIKDKRFVLVGRGIYALKEWGYKQGTVLDVLLEILNKDNKKMSQREIIEKVLEKRKVKKNTIVLNLQNKKYFEKFSNKFYKLK